MDPHPEPDPQSQTPPPSSSNARTTASAPRGARGRGRARGRVRRVVPRQVKRRKPPPTAVKQEPQSLEEAPRGERAGRGRGVRGGRGATGRGGQRATPTYAPNVVGLGQIAPARLSSRVLSSGGSAATSRRSSVVSSMSVGGVSSTGAASSSTAADVGDTGSGGVVLGAEGGGFGDKGAVGAVDTSGRAAGKVEQRYVTFAEHVEGGGDSDDDMDETSFENRNRDIAPYAGKLTREGLLLPVSLPGLRSLPPEYSQFEEVDSMEVEDGGNRKEVSMSGKDEPMEIDRVTTSHMLGSLRAEMFAKGTVARQILSSNSSLMFMQLPGLLAFSENNSSEKYVQGGKEAPPKAEGSVAAAVAAAERMRGLGTDLRLVGDKGSTIPIGKLRFYRSGRVQIVMEPGGAMDLEHGIAPKVCQQAVLIDTQRKTCEELQNTVKSRLVAIPAIGFS